MKRKILNIVLTVVLLTGLIVPAFLSSPQPVHAASDLVQTIIGGGAQWTVGAVTRYAPIMGCAAYYTTESNVEALNNLTGTFSNFYVRTSSAPASHVYTLRVGTASTAMVVTLNGATSGSYTASTVSVTAPSSIDVMIVSTDGAATPYIYWTVDFTPTGSTTSSIILGGTTAVSGGTRYSGIYGYYATADATETNRSQVMPTSGTFSYLRVYLTARPGAAGDAYSFTLMVNGVATALTTTITDPGIINSDTVNTVAVVAGDLVSMRIVPINVPLNSPPCNYGMVFTATNSYESVVMASNADTLNPAATEYNLTGTTISGGVVFPWTATEANTRQIAGNFTAKKLYISLSAAPDNGAGTQSYTLALRNTGTTTSLSVTISETDTTGNNTTSTVNYSRGELMTLICVPVGTPTAVFARWSFVTYFDPDAVVATTWDQCVQKDYFTTGGDAGGTQIYGATYGAQSFTAQYAYSICYVNISLQRTGTPGTLTLALKATNAAGDPTGDDLATATANGDTLGTAAYTWKTFSLLTSTGEALSLEKGMKYVLVLKALNGSAGNYVQWYADTAAGYAFGNANVTTDGGSTWNQFTMAGYDYLFEFWGIPSLYVIDAKVFKSYKQANDWLIVCDYVNKAAPHYPNDDVSTYFEIQFRSDSTTVKAANPCQQWGQKPGSIYLSAAQVIPLEWGNALYNIVLISKEDSTVYASYTLLSSDWSGQDLDRLDAYCLDIARSIESGAVAGSADATLITNVANRGAVLNNTSSVYFNKGVPGLMSIRPNLFMTTTTTSGTTGQKGIIYTPQWQDQLGPYVTGVLTQAGNLTGTSGKDIGFILLMLGYLGTMVAFGMGHMAVSFIIAVPYLLLSVYLGLGGVAMFAVLASIVALLMFRQLFMSR